MAIRVHMKRKVSEDNVEALKTLIDRLRSVTTGQPGYVSGETLKRIDEPGQILVISKWKSLHAWQRWYDNPQRSELQRQIDDLLGAATEYEIYDYE